MNKEPYQPAPPRPPDYNIGALNKFTGFKLLEWVECLDAYKAAGPEGDITHLSFQNCKGMEMPGDPRELVGKVVEVSWRMPYLELVLAGRMGEEVEVRAVETERK